VNFGRGLERIGVIGGHLVDFLHGVLGVFGDNCLFLVRIRVFAFGAVESVWRFPKTSRSERGKLCVVAEL
jgi:hypothetical protein